MQFGQLGAAKPIVRRETDRPKPELRVTLGLLDVNVRRLVPLVTEEKESIAADPEYGWHPRKLSAGGGFGQPGCPLASGIDVGQGGQPARRNSGTLKRIVRQPL